MAIFKTIFDAEAPLARTTPGLSISAQVSLEPHATGQLTWRPILLWSIFQRGSAVFAVLPFATMRGCSSIE